MLQSGRSPVLRVCRMGMAQAMLGIKSWCCRATIAVTSVTLGRRWTSRSSFSWTQDNMRSGQQLGVIVSLSCSWTWKHLVQYAAHKHTMQYNRASKQSTAIASAGSRAILLIQYSLLHMICKSMISPWPLHAWTRCYHALHTHTHTCEKADVMDRLLRDDGSWATCTIRSTYLSQIKQEILLMCKCSFELTNVVQHSSHRHTTFRAIRHWFLRWQTNVLLVVPRCSARVHTDLHQHVSRDSLHQQRNVWLLCILVCISTQ